MTYTLEIPIEAAHMAEAEKKAWRILGGLPPGTPFRLALEGTSKAAQEENAERIYAETVGEAVSLVEKYNEKGGISEYIQNLRDGIGALGGIQALRKIVPELADKLADEIGPTPKENTVCGIVEALERCVDIIGHNDCTDHKTPNGFSLALDRGRKALGDYRAELKAEGKQPQGQRAWTRAELSLIEDGIVPASRRYDAEFVAAVKAKAEGGAR
jgi:hypothetical protein